MKSIFSILTIILSLSLNAQDGFKLTSATKQDWAGGQPMTGFGTYYVLHFTTTCSSEDLSIDKLWVGNKFYVLDFYIDSNIQAVYNFKTGDSLSIRFSFRDYWSNYIPIDFDRDYNVAEPPIDYKTEAMIEYTYLNKKRYYLIKELEELPYLAYP